MEYLLAWRMALAKNMLRQNESGVAEIAERVGYGSASAFSVAFTRYVGLPPARYAREQMDPMRLTASTLRSNHVGRSEHRSNFHAPWRQEAGDPYAGKEGNLGIPPQRDFD